MKQLSILLIAIMLLVSCTSTPTELKTNPPDTTTTDSTDYELLDTLTIDSIK
jgi:PBP1b-binding outer membrane lipoprotein LpoB